MTNISPATHKGLSESIQSNIEEYKKIKDSEHVLLAFKDNLESLKKIYGEYMNKIREIRELVELYNKVQHYAKANSRNARNWKNGHKHFPFVKTKVLISAYKTTKNKLEISSSNTADKKNAFIKLKPAANQ